MHCGLHQMAQWCATEQYWCRYEAALQVYYLDSGNPTNPQKLYNPRQRSKHMPVPLDSCVAQDAEQLTWRWATALKPAGRGPHMMKAIFDIKDVYENTLMNAHNQIRLAEYQECGQLITPDMLTVGMGGQTMGQYRTQLYLWAVLGAPLILSNDIRTMSPESIELVTNPEVLAIDQDPDCVMGSFVLADDAGETWIKPLADGTFAAALVNKASDRSVNVSVHISKASGQWGDFFPIQDFEIMDVRNIGERRSLGHYNGTFSISVPAQDAVLVKLTPVA